MVVLAGQAEAEAEALEVLLRGLRVIVVVTPQLRGMLAERAIRAPPLLEQAAGDQVLLVLLVLVGSVALVVPQLTIVIGLVPQKPELVAAARVQHKEILLALAVAVAQVLAMHLLEQRRVEVQQLIQVLEVVVVLMETMVAQAGQE